jgi:hypothetical protein
MTRGRRFLVKAHQEIRHAETHHQSKYPHYDVTGNTHGGHCNVALYKEGWGIVMWEI